MTNQPTDVSNKLRSIPLFKQFDDATISRLSEGLTFRRIDAGEFLFHAHSSADFCYIVSYGAIKLVRSLAPGKEVVMCFCQPGEFVGAGVMMNPSPRFPLTAIAVEDSGLLQIPRGRYVEIWQSDPTVARAVNLSIMGRVMEFQDDKVMAVTPVPQRIAKFLLRTLDQQPPQFGNRLNLRLARKDIAERVGTSVETVIRVLSQWTHSGWIETEEQRITVLDRAKLEAMIDSD